MSKPLRVSPLDNRRVVAFAASELANDSARPARIRRRKRAAAAALGVLGALAATSGVTGALDILSSSPPSANGSNRSVGRLTIVLANHGGFKLETCTSSSHDSSASDEDNTGRSNNTDTNYAQTIVLDGRTITIEHEYVNDYVDVATVVSNNNTTHQNVETFADETIAGINAPNETLSAWTDANPFIIGYGLSEGADDLKLSRLNGLTLETVPDEIIPGINIPNDTLTAWIGESGENPFIFEYRLKENENFGKELFSVNGMTSEEKQRQKMERDLEIIQTNIWRFSN